MVGGSGAGKTRFSCEPNVMQCSASIVILDPKDEVVRGIRGLLEKKGYEVQILDLTNMHKNHCYDSFVYLGDNNDMQRLVTNPSKAITPKRSQSQNPFWGMTASMLLLPLVLYLRYEAPSEEQSFPVVMRLLRAGEVRGGDNSYVSPLDELFDHSEMTGLEHITLKRCRDYYSGSAKTLRSIWITPTVRLEKFNLKSLVSLTITDKLDLSSLGEEKVTLFALIPDNGTGFSFLVNIPYTQLFRQLFYLTDHKYDGSLPIYCQFIMGEFVNVSLPDGFGRILSIMRSGGVSISTILQDLAQLKALFERQRKNTVGNTDEFPYLGGDERSTYRLVSGLLDRSTVDTSIHGRSSGRSGNYSTNHQISRRELLTPDGVRMPDDRYALLFIRGKHPIMDLEYGILKHSNVKLTTDGEKPPYTRGRPTQVVAAFAFNGDIPMNAASAKVASTSYEPLSDKDLEGISNL